MIIFILFKIMPYIGLSHPEIGCYYYFNHLFKQFSPQLLQTAFLQVCLAQRTLFSSTLWSLQPMTYPIHWSNFYLTVFKTWQLVIPSHERAFDGESAAYRSPVLLNRHDTRSWCFGVFKMRHILTLFHLCPSTLLL